MSVLSMSYNFRVNPGVLIPTLNRGTTSAAMAWYIDTTVCLGLRPHAAYIFGSSPPFAEASKSDVTINPNRIMIGFVLTHPTHITLITGLISFPLVQSEIRYYMCAQFNFSGLYASFT